jgi:hypothetical protein
MSMPKCKGCGKDYIHLWDQCPKCRQGRHRQGVAVNPFDFIDDEVDLNIEEWQILDEIEERRRRDYPERR